MKKITLLFIGILLASNSFVFSQSKKERKQQQYSSTKELVNKGVFTFVPNAAYTQKGRRIDLTTNSNSLEINKDTVISDLPFFGYSQVSSFEGDGGIKFTNDNTDYSIEYLDKKQKITLKFKARNKTETFDVFLTVFPDKTASLNVSSSQRDHMSYRGKIKAREKK